MNSYFESQQKDLIAFLDRNWEKIYDRIKDSSMRFGGVILNNKGKFVFRPIEDKRTSQLLGIVDEMEAAAQTLGTTKRVDVKIIKQASELGRAIARMMNRYATAIERRGDREGAEKMREKGREIAESLIILAGIIHTVPNVKILQEVNKVMDETLGPMDDLSLDLPGDSVFDSMRVASVKDPQRRAELLKEKRERDEQRQALKRRLQEARERERTAGSKRRDAFDQETARLKASIPKRLETMRRIIQLFAYDFNNLNEYWSNPKLFSNDATERYVAAFFAGKDMNSVDTFKVSQTYARLNQTRGPVVLFSVVGNRMTAMLLVDGRPLLTQEYVKVKK
jgi:uncharacterized coiled-coil DUF342 family protein